MARKRLIFLEEFPRVASIDSISRMNVKKNRIRPYLAVEIANRSIKQILLPGASLKGSMSKILHNKVLSIVLSHMKTQSVN